MRTHGHEIQTFPDHARSIVFETHPDGSPRRLDFFIDDQIIGRQFQDEDGQLVSLRHLRDNELHGPRYEFDDGALVEITHYESGARHGRETRFTNDGEVAPGYPKFFLDGDEVTRNAYLDSADEPSDPQ